MRLTLVFSIAAAIPATLSAAAVGAQTRPAPPAVDADASATTPHIRGLRPAPPGTMVREIPAAPITHGSVTGRMPPTPAAPASMTTWPPADAAALPVPSTNPAAGQAVRSPTRLTLESRAGSATARTVTLECDPVGGTHPKAAQACADLAKARRDLTVADDGKNPRACFMIYSPVTISAEGQWRGEPLNYTGRYPNTCVLRAKTGSIFDF